MPIIELRPRGVTIEVRPGARLETILFPYGIEFPCGGAGTCGGCRVRVLDGDLPVTPEMRNLLRDDELAAGWRLACTASISGDVTLEVEQWETPVLADSSHVEFEPAEGRIIVIDVGTTTIAAQLLDARTGEVLSVETSLNPQAAYGADLMTRVARAMDGDPLLTGLIREETERIRTVFGPAPETLLCGNTVMQHLFCGASVRSLAHVPFTPVLHGEQRTELGTFLPSLGGFVGSDILAGIVATGLHESAEPAALIDLGTNAEIVVGNRERILCASAAAGPAFEAGRIGMGMRAAEGAIAHVAVRGGRIECRVIGDFAPRGICGSGLVDAVAAGLETGAIQTNGRGELPLAGPVVLTQRDIREVQLAKAAIAAGLRILASRFGLQPRDIRRVWLAGAFGNYVNVESARRIGLLETHAEPAGNAALRGTRIIALRPSRRRFYLDELPARVEHVPLASDPLFQDTFVDCLAFG